MSSTFLFFTILYFLISLLTITKTNENKSDDLTEDLFRSIKPKKNTTKIQELISNINKFTMKENSENNEKDEDCLNYEDDSENSDEAYEIEENSNLTDEEKRKKKNDAEPKVWDHWGKWSTCSVTCGIGKQTRWRHCVSGSCASGEKEAQIKSCTFPAC